VPVFTEYLSRGEEEAARRTFRAMWTLLGLSFGVISLILLALTFTPWGAKLAPRHLGEIEHPPVGDAIAEIVQRTGVTARPSEDKVANWLPAPQEEFSLYIRAYWPLPPSWTPPAVVPVG